MTPPGTSSPKTAAPRPAGLRLLRRVVCRILGHRWRFLHNRDDRGKIYRCARCDKEALFVR